MKRYSHIADYLFTHPWAILPGALDTISEIIQLRIAGISFAAEEVAIKVAAAKADQGPRNAKSGSGIGVIPIYGPITPKASLMSEMSGATTVDDIRGSLRAFLAEDSIGRIVFDVDSPGGSVEGIPELAAEIRAARGAKPMTAVANYTMASAAYWLAAQADEIVASPSALVGSIGIYGVHRDHSAQNERKGVRPTYISAGKYKLEGSPDAPLGDEALAHMQSLVNASYDQFTRDVAAGRGVSIKAVLEGYGEGRAFHAQRALDEGLVDRVATFEEAVIGKAPRMRARRREAADAYRLEAETPLPAPDPPNPPDPEHEHEHVDDQGEDLEVPTADNAKLFEFERERRKRAIA